MPVDCRRQIILDYAKWTALSALRFGAQKGFKSREDVYPLLDAVAFADVLCSNRAISASEFNDWHKRETVELCGRANLDPRLPTESTKVINIYIKTATYVGNLGRAFAMHFTRQSTGAFWTASNSVS